MISFLFNFLKNLHTCKYAIIARLHIYCQIDITARAKAVISLLLLFQTYSSLWRHFFQHFSLKNRQVLISHVNKKTWLHLHIPSFNCYIPTWNLFFIFFQISQHFSNLKFTECFHIKIRMFSKICNKIYIF